MKIARHGTLASYMVVVTTLRHEMLFHGHTVDDFCFSTFVDSLSPHKEIYSVTPTLMW